ncbi:hypothetical protein CEUSTIGMA_g4828.t1 [Chlamydomonas eustigma]|uniref:TRAPPC10/Trs130 N-terminal domain-containing protein n=1 Tax=Chlamydomonas eustigma TaxID=1157962 RepID=A0A250X3A3_9CHLO|nr:hypothetical protein CEUSTIGMA_g4828.t1 [Chlamydomonas eustigma]|eukprot:GAX77382.1 hypothetical protein CEUSTIGMA_g4828.t1 [Chlamydomonas eustigma]
MLDADKAFYLYDQVSTADSNEYKVLRVNLKKAIADLDQEWGSGSEWSIVYIRPMAVDAQDKGAKKVFDRLVDDFGSTPRLRDRVVRLDPLSATAMAATAGPSLLQQQQQQLLHHHQRSSSMSVPGMGVGAGAAGLPAAWGLEDLDVALRECVKNSFHARHVAYMDEARSLLNQRLNPDWSFASFYLVKDSLALLLDGAGMSLDAYHEHMELEACYLEALARAKGSRSNTLLGTEDFGASSEGDDAALLVGAHWSWRQARRMVMSKNGASEFKMRQYLFSSQTRLLLKLGRPIDVLESGMRFISSMRELMETHEAKCLVKPMFKEAWTFSACMSLLTNIPTSRIAPGLWLPTGGGTSNSHLEEGVVGGTSKATAGHTSAEGADGVIQGGGLNGMLLQSSYNWDLGAPASWFQDSQQDVINAVGLAGAAISPGWRAGMRQEDLVRMTAARYYHLLLGHVYVLARAQLLRLASHVFNEPVGKDKQDGLEEGGVPGDTVMASLDMLNNFSKLVGQHHVTEEGSAYFEGAPVAVETQQQMLHTASLVSAPDHMRTTCSWDKSILPHHPSATGVSFVPHLPGASSPQGHASSAASSSEGVSSAAAAAAGAVSAPQPVVFTPQQQLQLSAPDSQLAGSKRGAPPPPPPGLPPQPPMPTVVKGTQDGRGLLAYQQPAGHTSAMVKSSAPAGSAAMQSHNAVVARIQRGHHQRTPSGFTFINISDSTPQSAESLPELDLPQFVMMPQGEDITLSSSWSGGAGTLQLPSGATVPESLGQRTSSLLETPQVLPTLPTRPSSHPGMPGGEGTAPTAAPATTSATNSTAGFLSKLDNLASKVTSILDRPAAGIQHMFDTKKHLPAPLALDHQSLPLPRFPPGGIPGEMETASPDSSLTRKSTQSLKQKQPSISPGAGSASTTLNAAAIAPDSLPWLTERRLKVAFASPQGELLVELGVQLSTLAAHCYGWAGRQRNACLLYADIASVLLASDHAERAYVLLERIAAASAVEGWTMVLGLLLPQIIRCQALLGHTLLPHTCVRLLGLPDHVVSTAAKKQVVDLMMSMSEGEEELGLEPLHGLSAIMGSVVLHRTSVFYGESSIEGLPLLQPPSSYVSSGVLSGRGGEVESLLQGSGQSAVSKRRLMKPRVGAQRLQVGEVVEVQVNLFSNCPETIYLRDVSLVLASLGKELQQHPQVRGAYLTSPDDLTLGRAGAESQAAQDALYRAAYSSSKQAIASSSFFAGSSTSFTQWNPLIATAPPALITTSTAAAFASVHNPSSDAPQQGGRTALNNGNGQQAAMHLESISSTPAAPGFRSGTDENNLVYNSSASTAGPAAATSIALGTQGSHHKHSRSATDQWPTSASQQAESPLQARSRLFSMHASQQLSAGDRRLGSQQPLPAQAYSIPSQSPPGAVDFVKESTHHDTSGTNHHLIYNAAVISSAAPASDTKGSTGIWRESTQPLHCYALMMVEWPVKQQLQRGAYSGGGVSSQQVARSGSTMQQIARSGSTMQQMPHHGIHGGFMMAAGQGGPLYDAAAVGVFDEELTWASRIDSSLAAGSGLLALSADDDDDGDLLGCRYDPDDGCYWRCSDTGPLQYLELRPGLNRLTFTVAPSMTGLYFGKHVTAMWGGYQLHIPLHSDSGFSQLSPLYQRMHPLYSQGSRHCSQAWGKQLAPVAAGSSTLDTAAVAHHAMPSSLTESLTAALTRAGSASQQQASPGPTAAAGRSSLLTGYPATDLHDPALLLAAWCTPRPVEVEAGDKWLAGPQSVTLQGSPPSGQSLGVVNEEGCVLGKLILLEVLPPTESTSVSIAPVVPVVMMQVLSPAVPAPGACLVLGEEQQWLGVLIVPPQLPPGAAADGGGGVASSGESPRKKGTKMLRGLARPTLHLRPVRDEDGKAACMVRLDASPHVRGSCIQNGEDAGGVMAAVTTVPPPPSGEVVEEKMISAFQLPAERAGTSAPDSAVMVHWVALDPEPKSIQLRPGASASAYSLDISSALEEDVIDRPILVWLPVTVANKTEPRTAGLPHGRQQSVPDIVHVQVEGGVEDAPHSLDTFRPKSLFLGGASAVSSASMRHYAAGCVKEAGIQPASMHLLPGRNALDRSDDRCHLEVGLEHLGEGGCWTTHLTTLEVGVRPAFDIKINAHMLPDGQAVISAQVRYQGSCPTARLLRIELKPSTSITVLQQCGCPLPGVSMPQLSVPLHSPQREDEGSSSKERSVDDADAPERSVGMGLQFGALLGFAWFVQKNAPALGPSPSKGAQRPSFFNSHLQKAHSLMAPDASSSSLPLGIIRPYCEIHIEYSSGGGGGGGDSNDASIDIPEAPSPREGVVIAPHSIHPDILTDIQRVGLPLVLSSTSQCRQSPPTATSPAAGGTASTDFVHTSVSTPVVRRMHSYQHQFSLKFPVHRRGSRGVVGSMLQPLGRAEDDGGAEVSIRMLGPVLGTTVGRPLTLAWQLQRLRTSVVRRAAGSLNSAAYGGVAGLSREDEEVIHYRVVFQGSSSLNANIYNEQYSSRNHDMYHGMYQSLDYTVSVEIFQTSGRGYTHGASTSREGGPLLACSGGATDTGSWRFVQGSGEGAVRLGLRRGSVAVVQQVVVPLKAGYLVPPRLHIMISSSCGLIPEWRTDKSDAVDGNGLLLVSAASGLMGS